MKETCQVEFPDDFSHVTKSRVSTMVFHFENIQRQRCMNSTEIFFFLKNNKFNKSGVKSARLLGKARTLRITAATTTREKSFACLIDKTSNHHHSLRFKDFAQCAPYFAYLFYKLWQILRTKHCASITLPYLRWLSAFVCWLLAWNREWINVCEFIKGIWCHWNKR